MNQEQISNNEQSLKIEINLPEKQVSESTKRQVMLIKRVESFCGCGGGTSDIEFLRWVDEDSPLSDGDIVDEIEADDII